MPPEVVLHRRTHFETEFSSYVWCPSELFNFHKIMLHVPIVPSIAIYVSICLDIILELRKCYSRYFFIILYILMFDVFSTLFQHDDLLTTSSVTLQHMIVFSFTTTTSFYC